MDILITVASILLIGLVVWFIRKNRNDETTPPEVTPTPSPTPSNPNPSLTVEHDVSNATFVGSCNNTSNNVKIPALSTSFTVVGGSGNFDISSLNANGTFPSNKVDTLIGNSTAELKSSEFDYEECPRQSGFRFYTEEFKVEDKETNESMVVSLTLSYEIRQF